ncbi:MAG TPA: hypothetical protein PKA43_00075 [Candidatus Competibacter phosphatis]|nr:hypothetical protein [Candidatus Competibacter phosphatis]
MPNNEILSTLITVLLLAGVGALYWLRWRKAPPDERQTMMEEAVERLVQEAEYLYPQRGKGYERLRWVLGQVRKTWPDASADEILPAVDTHVAKINQAKAATRAYSQRNGSSKS